MTQLLGSNSGIILRRLDRDSILIKLPMGGTIRAPACGLDPGEQVVFTIDEVTNKVVKVIPRDVAEVQQMLAADVVLSVAVNAAQTEDDGDEEDDLNLEPLDDEEDDEEVFDAIDHHGGIGFELTRHSDHSSDEFRETVVGAEDQLIDYLADADEVGFED